MPLPASALTNNRRGMSLPYSASIPAEDADKQQECLRVGRFMKQLLAKDLKPRWVAFPGLPLKLLIPDLPGTL